MTKEDFLFFARSWIARRSCYMLGLLGGSLYYEDLVKPVKQFDGTAGKLFQACLDSQRQLKASEKALSDYFYSKTERP